MLKTVYKKLPEANNRIKIRNFVIEKAKAKMSTVKHEAKIFENINYSEKNLSGREFTSCEFKNCNFTKSDLSNNSFEDCTFRNCNFSMTILRNTGLRTVKFMSCKLMGIDFSVINNFLFSVAFQDNILDYSSFFQCNMKKTNFIDCSLKQVDFGETDLSRAVFKNCDLALASFMHTNLEKTDFRTAKNYSLDPEQNKMEGAKFSHVGLAGLLYKYNLDIE